MVSKEELEKQAQDLLSEAQKLINKAGELAKEGGFILYFGETGHYLPKKVFVREQYRAEALAELQKNGRYNGYYYATSNPSSPGYYSGKRDAILKPATPFSELTPEEVEVSLEKLVDDFIDNLDIPNEYREYGDMDGTDSWWAPSRC